MSAVEIHFLGLVSATATHMQDDALGWGVWHIATVGDFPRDPTYQGGERASTLHTTEGGSSPLMADTLPLPPRPIPSKWLRFGGCPLLNLPLTTRLSKPQR